MFSEMKTYAEIKAELERLASYNLRPGDWVWLKATEALPRQKAQLRAPLEAVLLVSVGPEDSGDDGLRIINADRIEGPAE